MGHTANTDTIAATWDPMSYIIRSQRGQRKRSIKIEIKFYSPFIGEIKPNRCCKIENFQIEN